MTDAPRPIRIDPDVLALEPLKLDPAAFQSILTTVNVLEGFENA